MMDENPYESPKDIDQPRKGRWGIEWKPNEMSAFAGYGALMGLFLAILVVYLYWFSNSNTIDMVTVTISCAVLFIPGGLLCGIVVWAMRN